MCSFQKAVIAGAGTWLPPRAALSDAPFVLCATPPHDRPMWGEGRAHLSSKVLEPLPLSL